MRCPTTGAWNETWKPIEAKDPSGRKSPVKKSDASVTVGEPDTLCNAIRISSVIARSRDRITSKATGCTGTSFSELLITRYSHAGCQTCQRLRILRGAPHALSWKLNNGGALDPSIRCGIARFIDRRLQGCCRVIEDDPTDATGD